MLKMAKIVSLVFVGLCFAVNAQAADISFQVSVKDGLLSSSYNGRVYVVLGSADGGDPMSQMGWVTHAPLFVTDVENWQGADPVTISGDPLSYPVKLSEIEAGDYSAQAFIRLNKTNGNAGSGVGDIYSQPVSVTVSADGMTKIALVLDQVVTKELPTIPDNYRYIEFKSDSLSAFHDMEYSVPALVRLPKDWREDDDKKWPVIYYVTGFGGGYEEFLYVERGNAHLKAALDQAIVVAPSAESYRGHTVFADSANNGPWGYMLVHEMASYIDENFGGKGPSERYVTGISSGGWSSIWLQISYPDEFAGAWSHVPDSVDFRDFQQMNLYAEETNVYTDEDGNRRPISRPLNDAGYVIYVDNFAAMERAKGPGGQYHAFEAVFSPRGEDGEPLPFFDRDTGQVDRNVTESWKPYDITLKVRENWPTLKDKIKGKLFIYAGEFDSFYLEGAVRLLKAELEELGSDAVVEIVPGLPHTFAPNIWSGMLETITGVKTEAPQEEAAE